MFLRRLLVILFCFFCVVVHAEEQRGENLPSREEDSRWLANIMMREAHPGAIIFPENKDFLALPREERFRILYKRRVSYDEFNNPQYSNPRYGSFYYEGNPLRPNPKIEKEIIAKLRFMKELCRPPFRGASMESLRQNAEMASALIADFLSEDDWGRVQLKIEGDALRARNLTEADVVAQLKRREDFYSYRLRRIRYRTNMTALLVVVDDFISLLIRAYPDDMDKPLELFEKSRILQKTNFGKMSERYLKEHKNEEGCIHQSLIPIYNAICEAEARREKQNGSNPPLTKKLKTKSQL